MELWQFLFVHVEIQKAKGDNIILEFSFECKFVGKQGIKDNFSSLATPCVFYGDEYIFDSNDTNNPVEFATFVRKNDNPEWLILSDSMHDLQSTVKLFGVSGEYKPLEDCVYDGRGYITVPRELYENTDQPLEINFVYYMNIRKNML